MVVCDTPVASDGNTVAENTNSSGVVGDIQDIDELISFRIRDFASNSVTKMWTSSSTSVGDFVKQASDKLGIPLDLLELLYQDRSTGALIMLSKLSKGITFATVNIKPSRTTEYLLTVEKRKKRLKPKMLCFDDNETDQSKDSVADSESKAEKKSEVKDVDNMPSTSICEYVGKEFVGLRNQKSTCYMNSLLQSLFFSPEFRNAIYLHEFPFDPKKKSIGSALQKLFLRLQFSDRSSIETDEITRTFGWKDYENSIQQDIEELYRIIMDLLGEEFKKTIQHSVTESLYGGVMADYVECLKCNKRNVRRNLFLAVHLPVRVFGQPLPKPTLEEALKAYIQPELLSGNNQYMCEVCNSLVDAKKGLSFEKLPYLMCLQLQRSEFDYETMQRKKCYDKVCFPSILDMNEFVDDSRSGSTENESMVADVDLAQIRGDKYNGKRTCHSRPSVSLANNESPQKESCSEVNGESSINKNGNNVYQLLSVLIHRGNSSLAGHYYAYILDFETNRWYQFNDASVRRICEKDISETFGDSDEFNDDTGIAYMLIYRKIDPSVNSLPLTLDELPQRIVDLWKQISTEEKENLTKETYEKNIFRVPVYFRDSNCWESQKKDLILLKADTMSECAMKCYVEFFPGSTIQADCVRLCRFNEELGVMDMSFDGKENETFGIAYRRPKNLDRNDALMLEVRDESKTFDVYDPSDVVFKVHLVQSAEERILEVKEIHAKLTDSVEKLKHKVHKNMKVLLEPLQLIVQIDGNRHVLAGNNLPLDTYALEEFHELFVENLTDPQVLDWFVKNHYNCIVIQIEYQDGKLSKQNSSLFGDFRIAPDVDAEDNVVENTVDCVQQVCTSSGANPYLYYQIISQVPSTTREGFTVLSIKIDGNMTLRDLSRKIAAVMGIDEPEFSIYTVVDGKEYEVLNYSSTMENTKFETLRVKRVPRLLKGEGRMKVFLLELDKAIEDHMLLTDVTLNPSLTVKKAKELIQTKISGLDGLESLFSSSSSFRLRKKSNTNPSKVMKDNQMLSDYFTEMDGELFIQPLESEEKHGDQCHCMILRQWKPTELVLNSPIEIVFKYDYTVSLEKLLEDEISKALQIENSNLEVAVPDTEYPHNINPIGIHEMLTWFKLDNSTKKHISIYNDEGVLFARDTTHPMKKISPEMRRIYEEEMMCHQNSYTFSTPRKNGEVGLRINLARTPPSSS